VESAAWLIGSRNRELQRPRLDRPIYGRAPEFRGDWDVFTKFGVDGLERCLEAEALAGREIGGEDDLLHVVIGELVDIEVTWQPSSSSAIGAFDATFLPGGIGVTEPGHHIAHDLRRSC
jgi:hypothetical protein